MAIAHAKPAPTVLAADIAVTVEVAAFVPNPRQKQPIS